MKNRGVVVSKCPIKLEVCFPSCHWRKGDRCYFKSKRGRQIPELKRKGKWNLPQETLGSTEFKRRALQEVSRNLERR